MADPKLSSQNSRLVPQCRAVHTSVEDRDAHAASGASAGLTESYQRQEQLVTHLQKGVLP